MKRNRPNPRRERKRRRHAQGHLTKRESMPFWNGKSGLRLKTPKRGKIVGPVEQDRQRRLNARLEVPPELRKVADDMAKEA